MTSQEKPVVNERDQSKEGHVPSKNVTEVEPLDTKE